MILIVFKRYDHSKCSNITRTRKRTWAFADYCIFLIQICGVSWWRSSEKPEQPGSETRRTAREVREAIVRDRDESRVRLRTQRVLLNNWRQESSSLLYIYIYIYSATPLIQLQTNSWYVSIFAPSSYTDTFGASAKEKANWKLTRGFIEYSVGSSSHEIRIILQIMYRFFTLFHFFIGIYIYFIFLLDVFFIYFQKIIIIIILMLHIFFFLFFPLFSEINNIYLFIYGQNGWPRPRLHLSCLRPRLLKFLAWIQFRDEVDGIKFFTIHVQFFYRDSEYGFNTW